MCKPCILSSTPEQVSGSEATIKIIIIKGDEFGGLGIGDLAGVNFSSFNNQS